MARLPNLQVCPICKTIQLVVKGEIKEHGCLPKLTTDKDLIEWLKKQGYPYLARILEEECDSKIKN